MRRRLIIPLALLVGACASEPPPRPATLDPANPEAPEAPAIGVTPIEPGPAPAEPTAEPPAAATPSPPAKDQPAALPPAGHSGHQHGAGQGVPKAAKKYSCPMHPEVQSSAPGRCPKCGMKLTTEGQP
jgi:hypothetical protein